MRTGPTVIVRGRFRSARSLRRLGLVLFVFLLLSTEARVVTAAPVDAVPQLRRDGRWLVDHYGRVVIVHGVNLVWKQAPYAPPDTAEGFTAADAAWLAEHGFNGARIGTLWAGVTPTAPGVVDNAYLDSWDRVVGQLAANRIWTQFDFHQDQWHEIYGGEGVPQWAVRRPAAFGPFPVTTAEFPWGYWMPEQSALWDDFWADRNGLLDGWAQAWQAVAQRWRDQPYSMGYDLLNEPWAGSEFAECAITGCAQHYRTELQPAMDRVRAAIRQVDPSGIVWYEPQQLAGGRDVATFFEPIADDPQIGYSWHNYCPQIFLQSQGLPGTDAEGCLAYSGQAQERALHQADRMGAVGLMTEFGATDNLRALAIDTAAADQALTGWMHWAYKHWNDPTTADTAQGLFTADGDLSSTKPDKLRTLVRTYPQATAGIPRSLSFDAATGEFHYTYDPASMRAPTEIFVSPLHYPNGPEITVEGGRASGVGPDHLVRIEADTAAPIAVTIRDRSPGPR
ncbi:cellulase family glycosylhydrolase [Nocardia salmonicida]|uniref:cellulase family glycosylhydrolase n=1 Tax=Nocardia salmonicida TaxID=53431 RepID=UPI003628C7BB